MIYDWLILFPHTVQQQLDLIMSVYALWVFAMWIRPFDLGDVGSALSFYNDGIFWSEPDHEPQWKVEESKVSPQADR